MRITNNGTVAAIAGWAKRQSRLLAGLSAGIIIGGSVMAFASIPDANGVIHGCFRTSTGALRIIDSATQTCNSNETTLTWNQTGPQGPTGPIGPQGPAGGSVFGSLLSLAGATDLVGVDLQYRDLTNGDFTNTNLSGAKLSWSDLSGANLTGANLDIINDHVNFSNANFTNALTETGGRLTSSNFSGADMSDLHISSMFFNDSNFTGTDLSNVHFDNATLTGSDMSAAILTGAAWTTTICPDGTNSDDNGDTCVGHLTP